MSRFVVMSNAVGYLHRIALIILILQGGISARAQQNWFLYIQSESSQSFYVRIGEKIYSSSPVGHLVINGLRDSTYRLAIGFPQSLYREHQFAVPVRKKDYHVEFYSFNTVQCCWGKLCSPGVTVAVSSCHPDACEFNQHRNICNSSCLLFG